MLTQQLIQLLPAPPYLIPYALQVLSTYMDCDSDSLIYLSEPIGPACHTNAPTCYFTQLDASSGELRQAGDHHSRGHAPMTTLFALERTIAARRAEAEAGTAPGVCGWGRGVGVWVKRLEARGRPCLHPPGGCCPSRNICKQPTRLGCRCLPAAGGKPSWTARLLANPELLCSKVREEAGELCQTLEAGEGKERAASEAADLFYHAMVLLNAQVGGVGGQAEGGVGWVGGID